MLNNDELLKIWADAYNAALTGILSGRATDDSVPPDLFVQGVANQCKRFADQAIKDLQQKILFGFPPPPK